MKVVIIENIAPLYRFTLWQKLTKVSDPEYYFVSSAKSLNGIAVIDPRYARKSVQEGGLRWHFIRNLILLKRVIWQFGSIPFALKSDFDAYVFLGEMNILSIWISAIICRLRKKNVLFWGHGLYGNEGYIKKRIRLLFYKIPHGHFIYNERSRELMIKEGFDSKKLFVIYNSLDYDYHKSLLNSVTEEELLTLKKTLFPKNPDSPIVIFIGRLTAEKKIQQLLQSIKYIIDDGKKINCIIIGNGENDLALKKLATDLNVNNFVKFYGPCYDEKENAMLLSVADCCVSPGNVGLNAIHSLSFGTPVITHNDLNHQNPEISSVIENITGELFEYNNVGNLVDQMKELIFVKGKQHYRNNCIKIVDEYYNPYNQVEIFNGALNTINNNLGNKSYSNIKMRSNWTNFKNTN